MYMMSGHVTVTRASALAETDDVDSELASFTVSSRRPRWRWRRWGTGCSVARPQGWNGFKDADDPSPHGALFHRVHGRTLWTVENTGELVKLGHAANHSAAGEETTGTTGSGCIFTARQPQIKLHSTHNFFSNSPRLGLTDPWNFPQELQKFLRPHFDKHTRWLEP